jgi:hypothetical protein
MTRPATQWADFTAGESMTNQQVRAGTANTKRVFWHRELPPLGADPLSEHVLEASSARVPGTIAHRDDLWRICYDDLMRQTHARLEQEIARLEGDYAHVVDEIIDTRHDDAKGEAWLRGRFKYMLYRRAAAAPKKISQ